jgi:exonuclease III
MGGELVIVTWNLQGRDPARLELAGALEAWRPDVLLLQEADGDRLWPALPPEYATCLWWPAAGERPGIAIASRFANSESGTSPAGAPSGGRPRLAWATLRLADGELTVASVHVMAPPWPGLPRRRSAQRRAVAEWVAERRSAGKRVVIGGDFNTIDPSLDGLAGIPTGPTWRPVAVGWMRPIFRIDAVYPPPDAGSASAAVDDRWRASDHCPVVARIGLQGEWSADARIGC